MMNPLFTIFVLLIPFYMFVRRKRCSKGSSTVPPGSLGLPIIGQSLGLMRAIRSDTTEQWLRQRVRKYGPVSKLHIFGKPAVFIHGQAANKLLFTGDSNTIGPEQPKSMRNIAGEKTLFILNGPDHKRVRNALMMFLKPESLKQYIGTMDEQVNKHIEMHWQGKQQVTVLPQIKSLTFDIICTLFFGLEPGAERDQFGDSFRDMVRGFGSLPINLPFTNYNLGMKASARIRNIVKDIMRQRRAETEQKGSSSHRQDLIANLLNMRDENNHQVLTDDEIVQNAALIMIAGHDTSSVLITFLFRSLAINPEVYAGVLEEQDEIAKSKLPGELLTWEDLSKMKYTWRVACETLRIIPPAIGGFRKALKDIQFEGYTIPKGWQIFWATSMTHMDDNIFPEPNKFDPKRFESQGSVGIPPYSFIPFGGGPHVCPGGEFTRIETLVVMHYIVTRFTWKLCANTLFTRTPLPTPTNGLPIQIFPRKIK